MGQLHYDYRDIFKAPRLGLMGKNLTIMMAHLVPGFLVYLVLAYIALMISGNSIAQIWRYYFLFPFVNPGLSNIFAKIAWVLGIIFWLALILRGSVGVARCSIEKLRGNHFYTIRDSFQFMRTKKCLVYRAIMGSLIFVGFLFLLILIIGAVGKIPFIGEIIYGFFYDFPIFIISLLAVLTIFLLTTLFLTATAVVAVKGEDAMTAIFDGFSTVIAQPFKWFLYVGGSYIIARATTFVFTYFILRALQFTNIVSGIIMGHKQTELFNIFVPELMHRFPLMPYLISPCTGYSLNLRNFFDFGFTSDPNWSMTIGGIFMMISVFLILSLAVCYFLNTLICAQVIAFLDIRQSTHNERLADSRPTV